MIKSDQSHMLRSRVIDFLNQPQNVKKRSIFNINQELTDQQKMKILKKITSESDRYQLDLTYSLKNYQKASFLPPYHSQFLQTISKHDDHLNGSQILSKQTTNRDVMRNDQSLTPINNIQESITKQGFTTTNKPNSNNQKQQQSLNFTISHNDYITTRDSYAFDKYSISPNNIHKGNTSSFKLQRDIDQIKENEKDEQKQQETNSSSSQTLQSSNTPLILSKQYRDLFRKTAQQSKSNLRDNSLEEGSTYSKRKKNMESSQKLFTSIKYQPIAHGRLTDPFTDDIDELSVLRKRSNHDILSTKVSMVTPPSKIHTLVKRNNTYFFERSPQYKKEFFIAPSKNQYLRVIGNNQSQEEHQLIHNQYYDSNHQEQNNENENVSKEESSQNKTFSKDEFSQKYYKNASYLRPSQSLSTQSNQTFDQNSSDKFGNQTIQSIFKNQQQMSKSIQNEYFNKDNVSFQIIPNQLSTTQKSQKQLNIKQEYEINNTQESTIGSNYDDVIQEKPLNSPTSSKQVIFSNKLIPNFVPLDPEAENRASSNINSSKMFSPQQEDKIDSLRTIQDYRKAEKSKEESRIEGRKDSVKIRDFGEFEYSSDEKRTLAYERFIYNIGEYEKNIQSLLAVEHNQTPMISRKKAILPKIRIKNTKKDIFENPAPGHYNVNESSFQTNRGYTFSTTKKVSSITKQPQYIEISMPVQQKKKVPPPQEETAEQYFGKLMNEVKRQVDRETRQIGQVYLKADSIQDLNSLEQITIDRYSNELIQKMIQCKRHINNIKQHLRRDDPFFKKL